MTRVPVGFLDLFTSIDCFVWSKISLKFLSQALFCLMLTFVYWNYWISVHWFWNMSSGVLETFLGRIQIGYAYFVPLQVCGRFWQGLWLCGCTFHHQLSVLIQVNHPKFFIFMVVCISFSSGRRSKLHKNWFMNITRNSSFCKNQGLVGTKQFLKEVSSRFFGYGWRYIFSCVDKIWPRVHKGSWFNPLPVFVRKWIFWSSLGFIFFQSDTKAHLFNP